MVCLIGNKNPVCLRIIIHIAEAVVDVLDLTDWARQIAGLIRTQKTAYTAVCVSLL